MFKFSFFLFFFFNSSDDFSSQEKHPAKTGPTFAFAKHFQSNMVLQKAPARANIYGFSSEIGLWVVCLVMAFCFLMFHLQLLEVTIISLKKKMILRSETSQGNDCEKAN